MEQLVIGITEGGDAVQLNSGRFSSLTFDGGRIITFSADSQNIEEIKKVIKKALYKIKGDWSGGTIRQIPHNKNKYTFDSKGLTKSELNEMINLPSIGLSHIPGFKILRNREAPPSVIMDSGGMKDAEEFLIKKFGPGNTYDAIITITGQNPRRLTAITKNLFTQALRETGTAKKDLEKKNEDMKQNQQQEADRILRGDDIVQKIGVKFGYDIDIPTSEGIFYDRVLIPTPKLIRSLRSIDFKELNEKNKLVPPTDKEIGEAFSTNDRKKINWMWERLKIKDDEEAFSKGFMEEIKPDLEEKSFYIKLTGLTDSQLVQVAEKLRTEFGQTSVVISKFKHKGSDFVKKASPRSIVAKELGNIENLLTDKTASRDESTISDTFQFLNGLKDRSDIPDDIAKQARSLAIRMKFEVNPQV